MLNDILNEEGLIRVWSKIKSTFATKETVDLIIEKVATPPIYYSPECNINQNNVTVEYGSNWTASTTASFTQKDAGALTSAIFDGVNFTALELESQSKTMTITRSDITTTQTISAVFNYSDGIIKKNNFDIPDERGRILAGQIETQFTITPFYYYYYDDVADSWTASSATIRALTKSSAGSTKTLATGTTNRTFVVSIPSSKSITKVIDETALQADITSNYVYQGTVTVTNGNTDMEYKLYKMQQAVPYSESHNHKITIG